MGKAFSGHKKKANTQLDAMREKLLIIAPSIMKKQDI
jgi:hypothetical protein